jgi:ribosome biogenesis GTPase
MPFDLAANGAALAALGWGPELAAALLDARVDPEQVPARVVAVDRGSWLVAAPGRPETRAVVAGRARYRADDAAALPVVGDWVTLAGLGEGDGTARITAVLPRLTWFARLDPNGAGEQVLAANLDTIWVVASLEAEPSLRRIERILAMAWEGGAQPVVVLNKADLHPDLRGVTGAVEAVAPGVPVVAVSARTGQGLDALGDWLGPGRTLALIGPSGVGKSSLANRLLGTERQVTAATRGDGRGRHTTTRRELVRLPGGALLIDTPGLRTVLLGLAGDGLERVFAEVDELAAGCRFADCAHAGEPGCAVAAAVADGSLDPERLDAWHKLARERAWLQARDDPLARAVRGRHWRAITKSMRGVARDQSQ